MKSGHHLYKYFYIRSASTFTHDNLTREHRQMITGLVQIVDDSHSMTVYIISDRHTDNSV